ncbi:hypothetical protein IWX64_003344 [Arthrobacter sp. CAN_A212]|uniref:hypothetical protein n=1 Tax=Arthrobacter sp. CAN_A212 TaxID=2787719 RepID=UPI0018CA0A2B
MITATDLEDLVANHEGVADIYPSNPLTAVFTSLKATLDQTEATVRISLTTDQGVVQVKARIGVYSDAQSPAVLRSLAAALKEAVLKTTPPDTTCTVFLEIAGTRREDPNQKNESDR